MRGTTFLPEFGEQLIGGWAKVYRKDCKVPFETTAMFKEYKGPAGSLWDSKPATMIRKVALVQALREAFPDMYGGLYSQEEINEIDDSALPEEPVAPIVGDELINKETETFLLEKFDRDPQFAKKILSVFGYKKLTDVKQCDVEPIIARIAEVKAGTIVLPDRISDAQRKLLFAKADKEIIDKVIVEFGYDSVTAVEKKDFDEILKLVVDLTLESEYADLPAEFDGSYPWDNNETGEVPA